MSAPQPELDLSPKVSDEIRKTTCYMCACRCGINVHMKDGEVAYIEGNRDHPVNQGVLCAKGSAGIMQVNAPSRIQVRTVARVGRPRALKAAFDTKNAPVKRKAPAPICVKARSTSCPSGAKLNARPTASLKIASSAQTTSV